MTYGSQRSQRGEEDGSELHLVGRIGVQVNCEGSQADGSLVQVIARVD